MTRLRTAVIAAAILLLLAAGCDTGSKTASKQDGRSSNGASKSGKGKTDKTGMKTFTDPDGLFTVKHPRDWYANGASSLAVEMSPLRSNTNLRMDRDMSVASMEIVAGQVKVGTADADPKKFVDEMVDALIAAKPAASRGPVRKLRIAGMLGAWVAVEMSSKTGESVKIFVAMGADGRKRVQMLGYSPPDQWGANLKTFKSIAESFKFNNPKT